MQAFLIDRGFTLPQVQSNIRKNRYTQKYIFEKEYMRELDYETPYFVRLHC